MHLNFIAAIVVCVVKRLISNRKKRGGYNDFIHLIFFRAIVWHTCFFDFWPAPRVNYALIAILPPSKPLTHLFCFMKCNFGCR